MGEWVPVIYRGDGAWIGVMPSGEIGVGIEVEGRATLEGSRFIPMWPFLERDFSECLSEISRLGESLTKGGTPTPKKIIELTVVSAWKSGRPYWMRRSVPWAIEMVQRPDFDTEAVGEMLDSEIVEPEMQERLRHVSSKSSDSHEGRD